MNKVMTRTQISAAATIRPTGSAVARPTGTTPPRIPSGRPPATTPAGGRGRPGTWTGSTRPGDNRPPSHRTRTPAQHTRTTPSRRTRRSPARVPAPRTGTPTLPTPSGTAAPRLPQLRPTDHFAELLLAVLSGQRPVHAMLRHTAGPAYDELARLAELGPLRIRGTRGLRPVVRDVGWFVPREGALEVFARIAAGDRLRALAFRLEQGRDLRWRCTAVEVGA
ncbi:hypothetical protein HCJ93_27640 [Streptomyces sp. SBST2-5]|uniref:Uncharacterized protein n=1 Tax=Streptomyces composti TaxID=2720025 RepID=A0ABX1AE58_9ACTN|nr:hypothetical protein [Streptomyces composti]